MTLQIDPSGIAALQEAVKCADTAARVTGEPEPESVTVERARVFRAFLNSPAGGEPIPTPLSPQELEELAKRHQNTATSAAAPIPSNGATPS